MKSATNLVFISVAFGLAVLAIALVSARLKASRSSTRNKGTFAPRPIATANEQKMFWRLVDAFPQPEYVVLTQVSFGALLKARDGASRYSFSQKIADFVVTNKGFSVLAVVELDDASHRGREKEDANRDAMLMEAGYRVLRYKSVPDVETLRNEFVKDEGPPTQPLADIGAD